MLTGSGQPAPPRRALRHARSTAKVKVLMTANPSRLGATIPARPNGSLRTIAAITALNRSPRPALFAPRVPPRRRHELSLAALHDREPTGRRRTSQRALPTRGRPAG